MSFTVRNSRFLCGSAIQSLFTSGCSQSGTLGTVWAQTGIFHLKLLINFLSLSIAGSNWLACLGRSMQDRSSLRWSQANLQLYRADPSSLLVCPARDEFLCWHMFWHAQWDTAIVMVAHNNNDILMVPYEDLPDGDKDVISKAIEEFRTSVCCPTPKHVTI